MIVFEGMLTLDILRKNRVVFLPESGVEAVKILKYLNGNMGLPFSAAKPQYLSVARNIGIVVNEGLIRIDTGEITYQNSTVFAEARNLIPGYQAPATAQFNQVAERLKAIEARLAALEERAGGRVIKTAKILNAPGEMP